MLEEECIVEKECTVLDYAVLTWLIWEIHFPEFPFLCGSQWEPTKELAWDLEDRKETVSITPRRSHVG